MLVDLKFEYKKYIYSLLCGAARGEISIVDLERPFPTDSRSRVEHTVTPCRAAWSVHFMEMALKSYFDNFFCLCRSLFICSSSIIGYPGINLEFFFSFQFAWIFDNVLSVVSPGYKHIYIVR